MIPARDSNAGIPPGNDVSVRRSRLVVVVVAIDWSPPPMRRRLGRVWVVLSHRLRVSAYHACIYPDSFSLFHTFAFSLVITYSACSFV